MLILPWSPLAHPQITFYVDGKFDPADWQSSIIFQDGGTSLGAVTTEANGGNPAAYREMTFLWNAATTATRRIDVFFKYFPASYNPGVQGAIATIDYSEDGRVTADSPGSPTITLPARIGIQQGQRPFQLIMKICGCLREPP